MCYPNIYYPDLFVYFLAVYSSANYNKKYFLFLLYSPCVLSVLYCAKHPFTLFFIKEKLIFICIIAITIVMYIIFFFIFYTFICILKTIIKYTYIIYNPKMLYSYYTDIINATIVNIVLLDGKYVFTIIWRIILRFVVFAIFIQLESHLQLSLIIIFMGFALEFYDNKRYLIKKVLTDIKKKPFFYSVLLIQRILFLGVFLFLFYSVLYEVLGIDISLYTNLNISYLNIFIIKFNKLKYLFEETLDKVSSNNHPEYMIKCINNNTVPLIPPVPPIPPVDHANLRWGSTKDIVDYQKWYTALPWNDKVHENIKSYGVDGNLPTITEKYYKKWAHNNRNELILPDSRIVSILCPDIIQMETNYYFIHRGLKYIYTSNTFHSKDLTLYAVNDPGKNIIMKAFDRPNLENLYSWDPDVGNYIKLDYNITPGLRKKVLFVKDINGDFKRFPFKVEARLMKYDLDKPLN